MARTLSQLAHAWQILAPEIYYLIGLVVGLLQGVFGLTCKGHSAHQIAAPKPNVVFSKQDDAPAPITPTPVQINSEKIMGTLQQQQQQSSSPKIVVKHAPSAAGSNGTSHQVHTNGSTMNGTNGGRKGGRGRKQKS